MNAYARPEKPVPFVPFTGLPDNAAMRQIKLTSNWVVWKYIWDQKPNKTEGKWDKPPINARTGGNASSSDPETWSDYRTAENRALSGGYDGVGFVLPPDGSISGIDLDKCRDPETGKIAAWAQVAIDFGETYCEISPSGKGLRFFVKGAVEGRKVDAAHVEIYSEGGRYLTVTGQHLPGTPAEIREAPRTIAYLQERADEIKAAQREALDRARQLTEKKAGKATDKARDGNRRATGNNPFLDYAAATRKRGSAFFRTINELALENLDCWVPTLFPTAKWQPGTEAYRVTSADLGRDLEEDLSIAANGITDFGVHDLGDPQDGKRTAIDIVLEHGSAADAVAAALWLCEQLAVDPAEIGWKGHQGEADRRTGPRGDPPAPPVLHWHRDAATAAPREWLVRDLIPVAGKGLLSGQWGTGKSFIGLDLAGSVMTGEPFAGRKVLRRGGVLFLAPEGASELPIRLKGLVQARLAGAAESGIDPTDLPFCWVEECPRLSETEAVERLKAVIDTAVSQLRERYDLPLALIVLDTVAAGAGFDDENSAAETQRVMNALEALSRHAGAFVLGIDHFGKATETGTRGSSAKEAAADTVLAALGNRDEAGTVSNLRLAVRKIRGAPTGAETPYTLEVVGIGEDSEGEPVTTCAVRWTINRISRQATVGSRERWPNSLKVLREALTTALEEHGKRAWPFGANSPEHRAVPIAAVRKEFLAKYPVDGDDAAKRADAKRKAFDRAVKLALERGLVGSIELGGLDHLWIKPPTA
ncbi:conserved hypothetical protein [Methylobacterium sp. 4-46]|uniref:AAA family ATPase n=1 Tax=unclassified Methylobacterium TaxID=2615210 RepID=UPI000152D41D|nr:MULTISPECIES: AAA family ATPase [Methylobacterium]ACA20975.1 conserved hypothetical protein [Methylobacterium sp. 4-46]WFT80131.1 AAA family ATPase [Methylobacterium nodulans]